MLLLSCISNDASEFKSSNCPQVGRDEFNRLVGFFTFIDPKVDKSRVNLDLIKHVETLESQKTGESLTFMWATESRNKKFMIYLFSSPKEENRFWVYRAASDSSSILDKCLWMHH